MIIKIKVFKQQLGLNQIEPFQLLETDRKLDNLVSYLIPSSSDPTLSTIAYS